MSGSGQKVHGNDNAAACDDTTLEWAKGGSVDETARPDDLCPMRRLAGLDSQTPCQPDFIGG